MGGYIYMRFDEMELQEPILRAVKEMGFEAMTPIQAAWGRS